MNVSVNGQSLIDGQAPEPSFISSSLQRADYSKSQGKELNQPEFLSRDSGQNTPSKVWK